MRSQFFDLEWAQSQWVGSARRRCPHPFPHILRHPPRIHFGVNGHLAICNSQQAAGIRAAIDFEKMPRPEHIGITAFLPLLAYQDEAIAGMKLLPTTLREFRSPSPMPRYPHSANHEPWSSQLACQDRLAFQTASGLPSQNISLPSAQLRAPCRGYERAQHTDSPISFPNPSYSDLT